MADPTEPIRRAQQAVINNDTSTREELAREFGQVYDTTELQEHFEVLGFLAPYVSVRRKSDGAMGTLLFRHNPRLYFGFEGR